MIPIPILSLLLTGLAAAEPDFRPLFDGHDLTGWKNVNCAPETWTVVDGVIRCTGKPIGALRTTAQYENFVLELEWRHLTAGGNSGVFIWASPIAAPGVPFLRAIEVQVLDNGYKAPGKNQWYTTHGDVFPIHGATMTPFGRHNGMRSFPSEERSRSSPEWNQYRIVCSNGVLRLSVNGKEVSGGENCDYRKGYIGLESEGAPVEFRNIRLQELPPSGASAALTAPVDPGWRSLFSGVDLRGWSGDSGTAGWTVRDEVLTANAEGVAAGRSLWSEARFADAEFVVDSKSGDGKDGKEGGETAVLFRGIDNSLVAVPLPGGDVRYRRFTVRRKGREVAVTHEGQELKRLRLGEEFAGLLNFGLEVSKGAASFRNIYVRDL